jgi:putative membrane protein
MTRASSFALALCASLWCAPPAAAQASLPRTTIDPARSADAAFVAKAADVIAVDTELATLAATRASAGDVKALARRVLDARAVIARDLAAMAGTRQMPVAPRVPADAPAPTAAAALRSTPPGKFDAAFLAALIANGEAAVALFDAESRDGRDDEIKEWAARQLPTLREHLTAIRTLRPRPGS